MMLCPACGEPLDDFAPCACAFDIPARDRPTPKTKPRSWSMREMVAKKLERQGRK
jgi:hypothetical protein